jgi:hypothetical protein
VQPLEDVGADGLGHRVALPGSMLAKTLCR